MKIGVLYGPHPFVPRSEPAAVPYGLVTYEASGKELHQQKHLDLGTDFAAAVQACQIHREELSRLIYVIPESETYWFSAVTPFGQRKKIEAVLPTLLEDEWPGDLDEVSIRFSVTKRSSDHFDIQACLVRQAFIDEIEQIPDLIFDALIPATACLMDDLGADVPSSASVVASEETPADDDDIHAVELSQDSDGQIVALLTADEICVSYGENNPIWNVFALPAELTGRVYEFAKQQEDEEQAQASEAEDTDSPNAGEDGAPDNEIPADEPEHDDGLMPSFVDDAQSNTGDDLSPQLHQFYQGQSLDSLEQAGALQSLYRLIARWHKSGHITPRWQVAFAALGYDVSQLGHLPAVEDMYSPVGQTDSAVTDRVVQAIVRGSPFQFGSHKANITFDLPVTIGMPQWIIAAVCLVMIWVSSALSMGYKESEAEEFRDQYRQVFGRMFPDERPSSNVVRQARILLGEDDSAPEVPTIPVIELMSVLEEASPNNPNFQVHGFDYLGRLWNLNGVCDDFGCVDRFKANLAEDDLVADVQLNSAKATIRKDAVKFSITVTPEGMQEEATNE